MTKYVVEYSTGDEYASDFHTHPLEYNGSKEEFKCEFLKAGNGINFKFKLGKMLNNLELLKYPNDVYGWRHHPGIKVGSKIFDMYEHLYKREREIVGYAPEIYTLEEWFEAGLNE